MMLGWCDIGTLRCDGRMLEYDGVTVRCDVRMLEYDGVTVRCDVGMLWC